MNIEFLSQLEEHDIEIQNRNSIDEQIDSLIDITTKL